MNLTANKNLLKYIDKLNKEYAGKYTFGSQVLKRIESDIKSGKIRFTDSGKDHKIFVAENQESKRVVNV